MLKARQTSTHWLQLARQRERAHDLPAAFDAYQQALSLDPDSTDIVRHLADLAFRLNHWEIAEKLNAHLIGSGLEDSAIHIAYAACLREQGRYDAAIEWLKSLLNQHPSEAAYWDSLGSILALLGDRNTAQVFFDEALRLEPDNLHALFNRGCVRLETGDLAGGLRDVSDSARRFKDPGNRASAELTCAHAALAMGDLKGGWQWYEARHMTGTARQVHYDLKMPRRKPLQPLAGKKLFISAEQGLGDEVLYASLLPDVIAEIGEDHLGIGVEPRLAPLFRRSFPAATVLAHHTETRDGRIQRHFPGLSRKAFDLWALMGDFLSTHRNTLADFPVRDSYLKPDPARVAHWRAYFAQLSERPKAGILWKSLKSTALRDHAFSPFDQWRQVLDTPDVQFINLQYGDTTAELEAAQKAGFNIHTPQGIDLKQDLDDLAALSMALDLIIGPSNATTNIAGACGANVWLVTPPNPWLALGQESYPWYPKVRLFKASSLGDWSSVLATVADQLRTLSKR